MQILAYPPALRAQLADLDLQRETGHITPEMYDTLSEAWIAQAQAVLGLDETWRHGTTPEPEEHYPGGRTMVFYRLPEDLP
jgi:hypothetical protein